MESLSRDFYLTLYHYHAADISLKCNCYDDKRVAYSLYTNTAYTAARGYNA